MAITICCILKMGGDYNKEYVDKLYKGVQANLTYEHRFICLTDDKQLLGYENLPYCVVALKTDLDALELNEKLYKIRNYWAKLEIFRLKGKVLYFDLDTVICGSLDSLYDFFNSANFCNNKFIMLRPFHYMRSLISKLRTICVRKSSHASGILAWNGNFSYLFENFKPSFHIQKFKKWDQNYISSVLINNNVKIDFINKYIMGIYSYKFHCKKQVPNDASIVCFHGKPRPHQVGGVFWK